MIDVIKTLKNLNKKFPRFQLNTLFDILYCIEEKNNESPYWLYTTPRYTSPTITCTNDALTCTNDTLSANNSTSILSNATCAKEDNMLFEPKKHHVKDKTSKNVKILTEEAPADDDEEMDMDDMKFLYKETVDLLQDYLNKLDINDILK